MDKKTPCQELTRLNGTRDVQKEERMWKMTNDMAIRVRWKLMKMRKG